MEKKKIDLTEEQIHFKQVQLEKLKIELVEDELQIDSYEKMLKSQLPERKVKSKINDLKNQIETIKRNTGILEKQIKERQETIIS